MTRTNLASLVVLIIGIPAAAAATFFTSAAPSAPCFMTGPAAYRMTADKSADYTVRIDNAAAQPNLRLQLVDDAASADFVLLDDNIDACPAGAIKTVRLDPAAAVPSLTVSLSAAQGDERIYVKSAQFSGDDAAALFAVIWHQAQKAGLAGRKLASHP
jgi:hypothetical protein